MHSKHPIFNKNKCHHRTLIHPTTAIKLSPPVQCPLSHYTLPTTSRIPYLFLCFLSETPFSTSKLKRIVLIFLMGQE